MARKLQDRLALASYKTKNGLDSLSFNLVEAHFEETVSKRRPGSSVGSSSASTTSSDMIPYNRALQSSPLTAPIFSDDVYPHSGMGSRKRARFAAPYNSSTPSRSGTRSRRSRRTNIQSSPIKHRARQPKFSASSPLAARYHSDFRTREGPQLSFVSTSSTISESPPMGHSEEEAPSLPKVFHGTPPRTPPPTRSRVSRTQNNGEEGADLLLYLATSPSPARAMKSTPRNFPPSTPPQNHAALPSSMLNTPGGSHNLFTTFSTPGQQFNFADFVNVTPSPAQAAFNRTPGPASTPLAAREARRRLNFDQLQPPTGSPNLSRTGGLGMDLGGELGA
jgi:hypothetical protein